jgi:hypothetical protein
VFGVDVTEPDRSVIGCEVIAPSHPVRFDVPAGEFSHVVQEGGEHVPFCCELGRDFAR